MSSKNNSFHSIWARLSASARVDASLAALVEAFDSSSEYLGQLAKTLLVAELRRREGAADEAYRVIRSLDVSSANLPKDNESKSCLAKYYHCRGLLERERGHFYAAASDFLSALEVDPLFTQSLFALQFTRLEPEDLALLFERLEALTSTSSYTGLMAGQLSADWSYLLGDQESALVRAYHSAKLSASSQCDGQIDHLHAPSFPEALIVGAPKCGTTSIASWLSVHPRVYVHPRKELHFFDARWDRGPVWYQCQFPRFRQGSNRIVRLEATPNYLQLPEVPGRVYQLMPKAKIIVLLRHPLDRAVSWYQHIVRQEGVDADLNTVFAGEIQEISRFSEEELLSLGWHGTNCLFGSLYKYQLDRWRSFFPGNQILVLQMEKLLQNPQQTWSFLADFLELSPSVAQAPPLPRLNAAPSAACPLDAELAAQSMQYLHGSFAEWEEAA